MALPPPDSWRNCCTDVRQYVQVAPINCVQRDDQISGAVCALAQSIILQTQACRFVDLLRIGPGVQGEPDALLPHPEREARRGRVRGGVEACQQRVIFVRTELIPGMRYDDFVHRRTRGGRHPGLHGRPRPGFIEKHMCRVHRQRQSDPTHPPESVPADLPSYSPVRVRHDPRRRPRPDSPARLCPGTPGLPAPASPPVS